MEFVSISEAEFVKEAIDIVEKARKMNIVLRILGALAIHIHSAHSEKARIMSEEIKRFGADKPKFTDLDLITYSKQRKQVMKWFEKELGFKPNHMINALFSDRRIIYYHPKGYYHVDIFFDKLEFSHDVNFGSEPGKGRLELDYPTIGLAEIVLEKTQIHEINLKDIVDLAVLFVGHDVTASSSRETIDGKYIANILSDDWGFWYDATNNLRKVKQFTDDLFSKNTLKAEQRDLIKNRVDKLLKIIDETPKTKKWLKRSNLGVSKPWYRKVEEIMR